MNMTSPYGSVRACDRALRETSLLSDREKEDSFLEWIFVNKTIEQNGEDWVSAALVDGSIGYYGPESAGIVVEEFKRGETENFSERCMALYKCDLLKELVHDIKYFERREQNDGEGARRLIRTIQQAKHSETKTNDKR